MNRFWRWHSWFQPIDPPITIADRRTIGWLLLSSVIPLYFGGLTWLHSVSQPYIVQDDARQHVVFLERLWDPQLFPKDPIADYFQAVAPVGYKTLYGLVAHLGISPIDLAKILPLILGLIATVYLFGISLQLLPVPINGVLAVLIFNQQIWLDDSLTSATPRAFIYPIFTAFLYYLIRRSFFPCLMTIGLQGLFFPQLVFVQILILFLQLFRQQKHRFNLQLAISGILIASIVLLPYAVNRSGYGAAITLEQMKAMPEYGLGGRNEYFGVSFWQFWLFGNSGLRIPWFPSLSLIGLSLPWIWRSQLPLIQRISGEVKQLLHVLLASLVMYGLAHLLLLKLHFPSRYTYHTLRIILPIAAAIVLTTLLETSWRWLQQKQQFSNREKGRIGAIVGLILIVMIVPAIPPLFYQFQGWVVGEAPAIYQYLLKQPEQVRIASIAPEANNIPAFANRSTLVGREFALPHHPSYYQSFQPRVIELLHGLYSTESTKLIQLIDRYRIDFLLIEQDFMQPDYLQQDWLVHSSFRAEVEEIIHRLSINELPIIAHWIRNCTVASTVTSTESLSLIDAACIKQQAEN